MLIPHPYISILIASCDEMDSYLVHMCKPIEINITLSQYVRTPVVPIIAIVTHFPDLSQTALRLTPIFLKRED